MEIGATCRVSRIEYLPEGKHAFLLPIQSVIQNLIMCPFVLGVLEVALLDPIFPRLQIMIDHTEIIFAKEKKHRIIGLALPCSKHAIRASVQLMPQDLIVFPFPQGLHCIKQIPVNSLIIPGFQIFVNDTAKSEMANFLKILEYVKTISRAPSTRCSQPVKSNSTIISDCMCNKKK